MAAGPPQMTAILDACKRQEASKLACPQPIVPAAITRSNVLIVLQANGKVTVTLEGVATVLRVLQEKLPVIPENAAAALKDIHSQVGLRTAVAMLTGCC